MSSVGGACAFGHVFLRLGHVVLAHRRNEGLVLDCSVEVIHQLSPRDQEAAVLMRRLVESLVFVVGHWRRAVVSLKLLKALLLSRDDLPNGGAGLVGFEASRLIVSGGSHTVILGLLNETDSFLLQLLGPESLGLEFLVILARGGVLVALLFLSESCYSWKFVDGELLSEHHGALC